jgi:hypothetical protein
MTGDTICMVLNDMAVPSDYVHEHAELLNLANEPVQCLICDQSPCRRHSDEGMVIISDGHATVGENREFGDLTHQERTAIRYACYGRFHTLIFGIGKKRKRNELPDCVVDGIREEFPEPNPVDYVGFRPGEE